MQNVITIDGPSASGKSSVSRELSRKLGWAWVSTGAFYRALAFVAQSEGVALTDAPALVKLTADALLWDVRMQPERTKVFYRNRDVTDQAMAEATGALASQVSQLPEVRKALLAAQRACVNNSRGLVAEGRDCGSVVFPEAQLKIYLTASSETRASRRAKEQNLDEKEILSDQRVRDERDSQRAAAPLQIPEGAKVIDSSGMDLKSVVELIHSYIL